MENTRMLHKRTRSGLGAGAASSITPQPASAPAPVTLKFKFPPIYGLRSRDVTSDVTRARRNLNSNLQTNTRSPVVVMPGQYHRWCFTLNNYNLDTDYKEIFSRPNNGVRRCVWGREVGEQGTRHLQGYAEFKRSYRIGHCKYLLPRAHWEPAKGTPKQNYDYCVKDGEFSTYGDFENINKEPRVQGGKVDKTKCLLLGLLSDDAERYKNTGSYISRKRQLDERVAELCELSAKHDRYDRLVGTLLCTWQVSILKELFIQNDRKIMWVYDVVGGCGKSKLAHVLDACYDFDLFDGVTKTHDVAQMLSMRPKGIVFDVTRSDASMFCYGTLEACKNGFLMSGKYQGIKRRFCPVPVIVFANFEPDRSKLSEDRWDVHHIENGQKNYETPLSEIKATVPPPALPKEDDTQDAAENRTGEN